ncbi:hypothetical protein P2318_09365 [Myxococcaceae bacterium GXIMD 01537]
MLRLYKKDGNTLRYWEAWVHEGELTVHWGTVGEMGEQRSQPVPPDEDPDLFAATVATDQVDQGYEEAEPDALVSLFIQYPLKGKGTGHDFERRNAVEDVVTDILGWTGNGEVEGGETKPGRMNVYFRALDVDVAVRAVVEALDEEDLLEGAIIGVAPEEQPLQVLWPEGHKGTVEL